MNAIMRRNGFVLLASALLASPLGSAGAQDFLGGVQTGTGRLEDPKQAGDFIVRLRGLAIVPNSDGKINGIGGDVEVSDEYTPEIDFTYFLTDRFALELIAATARHNVRAENTAAGDLDLGKVNHLPPTLLLQWHVAPDYFISPYFGAGINYTIFYDADPGPDIDSINYDNSLGWALQFGTDIFVYKNLLINLDVKYIRMETKAEINNSFHARADINPWLFGVGIGYKF
jgi:outer membrane protein